MQKGKRVINPIIDWTDEDVWEYIHSRGLKYCKLYDEGFTRLGCIGCPNASIKEREKEFERYPKFAEAYKRAIAKFLTRYLERCRLNNREPFKKTVDEWWRWWLYEQNKHTDCALEGQLNIFAEREDGKCQY